MGGHTQTQSRILGRLLTISGTLFLVGSVVPAWVANAMPTGGGGLFLLAIALFGGGGAMIIRGKQHLTPVRDWIWVVEQPSPIIYLRSFDAERHDYSLRRYFAGAFGMLTGRATAYGASPWGPTFQAQLSFLMNRVGCYVAVGRPDSPLPGLGAVRCYLDEKWEDRVRELLDASALTVLRAGTTRGLGLEIALCKSVLRPQQLLMILPAARRDYAAVRKQLSEHHDIVLPEKGRALIFRFESGWEPVPLTPKLGLARTLGPFFRANGIEPPRSSWLDSTRLLLR